MSQSNHWEPEIIAFCCNYCAYAAADLAGSKRMQYPSNVRIIHSPCTGKIEMEHILGAFEKGIDGILVAGCLEGGCHFLEGNLRARKRTDRIREMLDEIGVGGERLKMVNLSAAMAPTFVQRVDGDCCGGPGAGPESAQRKGRSIMIVASPKPITELKNLIARHGKVLFVGCGTCVTVCLAGGEREVGIASYAVRMARKIDGKPLDLVQVTIERQCENEFIKDLAEPAAKAEAIVSFGCGVGVQTIAERFPTKPVYAGLNTQFMGTLEEQAVWTEKCLGCGDCMLAQFGGICPITRCAKRMLNGPCGGSKEERCEVSEDRPCAWQLIYTRLKNIHQLDRLDEIVPPKDWRPSWHNSPRKILRPEHRV